MEVSIWREREPNSQLSGQLQRLLLITNSLFDQMSGVSHLSIPKMRKIIFRIYSDSSSATGLVTQEAKSRPVCITQIDP